MSKIENTIWWITGASSGIGKSLAVYILKRGGKVILSSRNENKLYEIAKKTGVSENNYLVLPLDLENIENSKELVNTVINKFSRIDYLINNGGIVRDLLLAKPPLKLTEK